MQLPEISVSQPCENNINGGRNSKIGAGKMLKFDATMKCPGKIQCYLGCEGIGNCPALHSCIVGCEIESVCDPELDDQTFIRLLGPETRSIVRKQPTISELVNRAAMYVDP